VVVAFLGEGRDQKLLTIFPIYGDPCFELMGFGDLIDGFQKIRFLSKTENLLRAVGTHCGQSNGVGRQRARELSIIVKKIESKTWWHTALEDADFQHAIGMSHHRATMSAMFVAMAMVVTMTVTFFGEKSDQRLPFRFGGQMHTNQEFVGFRDIGGGFQAGIFPPELKTLPDISWTFRFHKHGTSFWRGQRLSVHVTEKQLKPGRNPIFKDTDFQ
jgi:hypothetical protein